MSETVNNLLVGKNVIEGEKVKVWKPKKKKEGKGISKQRPLRHRPNRRKNRQQRNTEADSKKRKKRRINQRKLWIKLQRNLLRKLHRLTLCCNFAIIKEWSRSLTKEEK